MFPSLKLVCLYLVSEFRIGIGRFNYSHLDSLVLLNLQIEAGVPGHITKRALSAHHTHSFL